MLVAVTSAQLLPEGHGALMRARYMSEAENSESSAVVYYMLRLVGITSSIRLYIPTVPSTSTLPVPNKPIAIHILGTTDQEFKCGQGLLGGLRSCEH